MSGTFKQPGSTGNEASNSLPHQFGTETRLQISETAPQQRPNFGERQWQAPQRAGWGFSSVDWGYVFGAQHWATLIWAIIFLICLGISHWAQNVTTRPFLNYDASISYVGRKDTVSATASWLVPFAVLIINLVVLECFVNRRHNRTISHALALSLHFLLDAICCFIAMRFIVEVTKLSAGRLRPDFLQDCYGLQGLSGAAQLSFANGSSASCTRDDADSRKSLPSGHASSSMVTIAYSIIYCVWTAYFRGSSTFGGVNLRTGLRGGGVVGRLGREFAHSALLFWIILQFSFTWATGITRFTDNKHNVSDIVAGWFIGAAFALFFAARAIGMSKFVLIFEE